VQNPDVLPDGWQLQFRFDDPYGVYFATHPSSWRLALADRLLEKIRSVPAVNIAVDNQPPRGLNVSNLGREPIAINIPAGLGTHTWKLAPAQ
jgi:hypothetical protein